MFAGITVSPMTNDSLMIVCGGGASRILNESSLDIEIQTVFLKHDTPALDKDDDAFLLSDNESFEETMNFVDGMLDGIRVAIIFSMLGGHTTKAVQSVMDCARSHGSKIIAIMGLPMAFEHERRKLGNDAIKVLAGGADISFIVDMDTINVYDEDTSFLDLLKYNSYVLAYAVQMLTTYVRGPFFSTFSEDAYTLAYSSDLSPKGSVTRALKSLMYRTKSDNGTTVAMVGGSVNSDFTFNLTSELIATTGNLPDIVKRTNQEDSVILFFFPVII